MPVVFANPAAPQRSDLALPTPIEFADRLSTLLTKSDPDADVSYGVPTIIGTALDTAARGIGENIGRSPSFSPELSAAFSRRISRSVDLADSMIDSPGDVWVAAAALEQAADILRHGGVRSLGVEEQVRNVVAAALRLRDRIGADVTKNARIVADLGAELLAMSPPNSAMGFLTRSVSTLRGTLLPVLTKGQRELQYSVDNIADTVSAAILAVVNWGSSAIFQVVDVIIEEYWRSRGGNHIEVPPGVWSTATAELGSLA